MLTVVVNNFRETERVVRCLRSVKASRGVETEIIVVDCQTPGLRERITPEFPDVRLISLDSDPGPSAQRKLGYDAAGTDSEVVVFLDNDCTVDPTCLATLARIFVDEPKMGLVQPVILSSSEASVEGSGGYLDPLFFATRQRLPTGGANAASSPVLVSYSDSAVCAIRRGVLNAYPAELTSFDPDYFLFFEDVDLSIRMWLAGYLVAVAPGAIAYNEWRVTRGHATLSPERVRLNERNRLKTLLRVYSRANLVKYLPLALVFDVSKALAVLRSHPKHARASLGAIFDVVLQAHDIAQRRRIIQRTRRLPDAAFLSHFVPLSVETLLTNYRFHYARPGT
ncbi:MAG TPA: glycosyltransferase [Thermoplasmata archaeon]|nr:glycosyltransferase [Thermoplasmata archaeon]